MRDLQKHTGVAMNVRINVSPFMNGHAFHDLLQWALAAPP